MRLIDRRRWGGRGVAGITDYPLFIVVRGREEGDRHGLTCDHLVSARMVPADGTRTIASPTGDSDLFWAIRGGGGNFGIVTEFEFSAVAAGPEVLAGAVVHGAERAPELLRWYRDFAERSPAELTTILNLRSAPPAPWIPREHHGRDVVIVAGCWAGDAACSG